MSKVIFLADFFKEDLLGGAEINDATLVDFFQQEGLLLEKVNCAEVTPEFLLKNRDKYFVISNFILLKTICKSVLYQYCKYSIYEHDYKFLKCRNPIDFPNFIAPSSQLTNLNFYKGAHRVVCLSKMQKKIYEKNIHLKNLENIGTSMFSEKLIQSILALSKNKKMKKYAVINSSNPIKRTQDAESFCRKNGYEYDLISHQDNNKFLEILSTYENLVFMTGHPEPTPRLAIECKLLGVKFLAPKKLIGIASEDWFNTKGEEFVVGLRQVQENAKKFFLRLIDEV